MLFGCALCFSALAGDKKGTDFYERKAEGWFWYDDPVPVPEPKEEPAKKEPIPTPVETNPKNQKPAPPPPMSSAWIRENMQKYMDRAIDKPTPENIQAFLLLQQVAMKKSQQFTAAAKSNIAGNPLLDAVSSNPVASGLKDKLKQEANNQKQKAISHIQKSAGIFYFFESDCIPCSANTQTINYIENSGYHVTRISIDGKNIPGSTVPFKEDKGHAQKLGITTLPAYFMASQSGEFAPLGQGLISVSELNDRVLLRAKEIGLISKSDYESTQLTQNPNVFSNISLKANGDNSTGFIEPEQLLKKLGAYH